MANTRINDKQGHWILAKMGKKVLRPGGKELTKKLINNLNINSEDYVVEFAPGLGYTASIALKSNPKAYTGIEINEDAAHILRKTLNGKGRRIVVGSAAKSNLKDETNSKVYGEAMLTMQADHKKSEIIKEAHRILKSGGLYGIHELALSPNDISKEKKAKIQRELAQVIKVNARPLTIDEWCHLLKEQGFKIIKIESNEMHLLEPKRVIDDEGLMRTIRIVLNILTHPKERKRILAMRKIFRKYQSSLKAISIIAEKQ
ncbi:class I SAM-dependent methyltransferase [Tenacibaculum xiamenense]|uniref:class I SAM-dependent methyltransferase n=1 Tax=Tenacibaculum xiamenense TaxID=1261553 RepID=UPI0038958630